MFNLNEDFWLVGGPAGTGFIPELQKHGMGHKVVDMCKKDSIIKQLSKNEYNVCVILNVHSGGNDTQLTENPALQKYLKKWMGEGGKLFIHGEGKCLNILSEFLGEENRWKYESYFRTEHTLAPNALLINCTLPSTYNVKSALVGGVAEADRVYATQEGATTQSAVFFMGGQKIESGLTTMAFTAVGEGRLGFIGDVNGESHTIKAVIELAVNG